MLGDWKCDCRSTTLADSAFEGSQALASFFSAPISLFDSGKAATTTTSHKPTTSHLVQLPAGISAIRLSLLIAFPQIPGSRLPRPLISFTMWFFEGKRAVRGLSRRLVDVDHHTGTGGLDVGELERSRQAPRSEQTLPAAQDDRIDPQPALIDEVVAHQCLGEIAASVDLELPTGLLLQRGDRFRGVPFDQCRVVPVHFVQRRRGHVLGEAVELLPRPDRSGR